MRTTLFAAAATLIAAGFGCGDNRSGVHRDMNMPDFTMVNTNPDLTMVNTNPDLTMVNTNPDLTMVNTNPDLTRVGPGCWAILTTGASSRFSPQRTLDMVSAFQSCAINNCGSQQIVDGGNASKPCAMIDADAGVPAACDICFYNIQVNDVITFTDPITMMDVVCRDPATGAVNPSAMYCKACATEVVNCILDCNSDRDCVGLTNGAGMTATCIDNICGF